MNKFLKFFTSTLGIKVDSYDENMIYGSVRFNSRASKLKTYSKKYYNYNKADEEYIKEYYENNKGVLEILKSSSSSNNKSVTKNSVLDGSGHVLQCEYIGLPEKLSTHKKCSNVKKNVNANKNKKIIINNKKNFIEKKKKKKSNKLNKYNRSNRIGNLNIKSDSYYSFASSSSSLYCEPYGVIYESDISHRPIFNSPRPQNKLVFNNNNNYTSGGTGNIEEQRFLGGNNNRYRPNEPNTSKGDSKSSSIVSGWKKENNGYKYETVEIGHNVHIHAGVHEKFSKMSGEKKEDKDDVAEKCIFTKSNECSLYSSGEFRKLPNLTSIMEDVGEINESVERYKNIDFYNKHLDEIAILDLEDSPLLATTENSPPSSSKKCTKNVLSNDSKNIIDWLKNIIKWK